MKLHNMLPDSPRPDVRDRRSAYAETGGQYSPRLGRRSYLSDFGFIQNGHRIAFSNMDAPTVAPLGYAVGDIVRPRAGEEMRRIDARWIVATMQRAHVDAQSAAEQSERKSVRVHTLPIGPGSSVPKLCDMPSPNPALVAIGRNVNTTGKVAKSTIGSADTLRASFHRTNLRCESGIGRRTIRRSMPTLYLEAA